MHLTHFYKFLLSIFFITTLAGGFKTFGTPSLDCSQNPTPPGCPGYNEAEYRENYCSQTPTPSGCSNIDENSLSQGYDDVGSKLYIGAGVSIVGGGILIAKGCTCVPKPLCIFKCASGVASVAAGGYMIGSAREQQRTARQLRDRGTNFNYCRITPAPPGCPGYVQTQYCDQDPIPPRCPGHTSEEYCSRIPIPYGCPGFTTTEYCNQVPKPSECEEGTEIDPPEIPDLPDYPDGLCDIEPKPPNCPGSIPLPEICRQYNISCNFDGDDLSEIKIPGMPGIKAPFDKNSFANAGIGEDDFNKAMQDFQKEQSQIVAQAKNLVNKKLKLNKGSGKDNDDSDSSSDFEPTLTSGGGSGRGRSFSGNNEDGSNSYLDMLKNSLANKNKAKGRKIQNFKPLTFGNDKIGTAYDNIFEQVSKSYNSINSSDRVIP